jgi:hypothetical protein
VLAVDTNVLVYAADADSQFHIACRDWLERQRARAWYTTWAILYEFLRVTTHARVMRRPWSASAAWNFVAALLALARPRSSCPDRTARRRRGGGHFGAAASCGARRGRWAGAALRTEALTTPSTLREQIQQGL